MPITGIGTNPFGYINTPVHCICYYDLGLVYKKVDSNQWNIFGDKRMKCSPGIYCNETPQFPRITLLKLSYLEDRQSLDGIMTKLFSASLHDEEV